ncbi:hypothetical protein C8J56DRAFT_1060526 [Mycena floridula]|nr:hypothetical protein C8J56DRAFT_1060526 [Mycena floridula]
MANQDQYHPNLRFQASGIVVQIPTWLIEAQSTVFSHLILEPWAPRAITAPNLSCRQNRSIPVIHAPPLQLIYDLVHYYRVLTWSAPASNAGVRASKLDHLPDLISFTKLVPGPIHAIVGPGDRILTCSSDPYRHQANSLTDSQGAYYNGQGREMQLVTRKLGGLVFVPRTSSTFRAWNMLLCHLYRLEQPLQCQLRDDVCTALGLVHTTDIYLPSATGLPGLELARIFALDPLDVISATLDGLMFLTTAGATVVLQKHLLRLSATNFPRTDLWVLLKSPYDMGPTPVSAVPHLKNISFSSFRVFERIGLTLPEPRLMHSNGPGMLPCQISIHCLSAF